MPKNQESLNAELAKELKRFRPIMYDTSGKKVPVPDKADVFQFPLVVDGKDYGTITISIDGLHSLILYSSEDVRRSPNVSENGDFTWKQVQRLMRNFAHGKGLSYQLSKEEDLEGDMAKREHVKLNEGYHAMGKKASYNDSIPTCKVILKHSKAIEEGEQRFRNVEKIFIENAQGERFLAPTVKPGIARVYARHIAEGGKPYDDRWNHIGSLVEEYTKMAGFVRATRGGQFNESTQKLVNEGVNHYLNIRESLHKLTTHKGYGNYFESWTPPLMEDNDDTSSLSEMFVSTSLDPRIESVLPILSKLTKNIQENKLAEVASLEEWADEIVEGSLIPKTDGQVKNLENILSKEKFTLGPDGSNAIGLLEPTLHDDELFSELETAGKSDPDGDAKDIVISWMANQTNPEYKSLLGKLQMQTSAPVEENKDEKEYGEDYQEMVKRAGDAVKRIEKKLGKVDIAKLAKKLNEPEKKVDEAGPAGKPGDYFDTEVVSTGPILGNKPQTQKGLRGKLVGESDLVRIKKLSGL